MPGTSKCADPQRMDQRDRRADGVLVQVDGIARVPDPGSPYSRRQHGALGKFQLKL